MAPNLIAGCLTLVAVWWLARRWFGPREAAAALALASFSDFHILYSRTALTDALLVFWLLLALLLITAGIQVIIVGLIGELLVYLHFRDQTRYRIIERIGSTRKEDQQ